MYIVMMIGARALPDGDRATLLVFIATYQIVTGLLSGVSTELTRTIANARASGVARGPRVSSVVVVVAIVLAVIVAATSPLWGSAFPGDHAFLIAMTIVTALGFTGHAALAGALSGRAAWGGMGSLLGLEALMRLLLSVAAAVLGFGLFGFAGAMTAAAFSWMLLLLVAAPARTAFRSRTDVAAPLLARHLAASVGALSATALLMAGYPMLLSLTTPAREVSDSPALLQAISLTRAPLLIPLTAFQTMLISAFVSRKDRAGRVLAILGGVLAAITAVGAALAWLIGPWLMRVLFTYEISGGVLGLLTLAAGLLAALTLCGALCQSLERHASFLGGWVLACAVSIGLLLLPGSLDQRAITSLLVGPAAGLLLMAPVILSASRRTRISTRTAGPAQHQEGTS
ncbi:hypothetical protein BRM3_05815 [Brachybacterium huguangmaarense]|uniref:Polysaccharide biosynthesis protein n=1 Tax=Brachybacterium huguangmaarense TaxID=1652028 RepID=A0ABY6G401_9MICO|nr:hypothetical protein [Brachybacterium huguangmaarense]UYG17935.1 hypothetical protein BRM3_05815 [Brachybacterium huguangmaarense]